jgi:hypothetical protein
MVMITTALRSRCQLQPMSGPKNYRCRTYTPLTGIPPQTGEERDSGKRTIGWVNNLRSDMSEKIIAAGPIPPARGTDRSISARTMGVG